MVLDGGVWDDEIAKWRPDIDATQVSYSAFNERKVIRTRKQPQKVGGKLTGEILEIPIYGPTDRPREDLRQQWDTVIFDESHYLKGRKTHWTKAALKIGQTAGQVHLATGTPIPNWAQELFTTLQLLYPDEAHPGGKYGSYWRWVKKWFVTWNPPWAPNSTEIGGMKGCKHGNVSICPCWERFHDDNLGDLFLQRLRDDVLGDLPPLTIQPIKVDMAPAQARFYHKLEKEFIAWIEETNLEVIAWNSAALTVKLAKAATGLEVLDPNAKGSGKFAALRDLLTDRLRPALVVAHFRDTVKICADISTGVGRRTAVLTGATPPKQRKAIVQGFQDGQYDTLCATIEVVAEGLTLTAADTIIRLERSYRPSKNEQVIRRAHRIGQLRPVTVIDLITRGTIDQHILSLLGRKTDQQMKALRPRDLLALVGR